MVTESLVTTLFPLESDLPVSHPILTPTIPSLDPRNMHTFTPKFILAASCFFLHLKSLCAAPVEEVTKTIQVRQYEDGDDELGAITNPLRNG